jgi:tRNA nucleotidyltransferase (CCA-adding enzyme)
VVPENLVALQEKAAQLTLQASAPQPILMGRHLLGLGLKPGPVFKVILDAAFEAQLEGQFMNLDQAHQWLAESEAFPLPPQARDLLARRLRPREEDLES